MPDADLLFSGGHPDAPPRPGVLPRAAYVHVPFCMHRCGYCDFTVVAGRDDLIEPYLECLEQELRQVLPESAGMQTLFIGGGTPSYLPPDALRRLLRLLEQWLPLEDAGEYSIECNPDRFTPERMDILAQAGINRVSLGVQSFAASELTTLERAHSPEVVAQVVEQLRSRGLENISLDLIYAVPGQSLESWRETLRTAVQLAPRHISTYGLTYEKGTAFWSRREQRRLTCAPEELEREMYALAMSFLPAQGWLQYELSNFAQPGWECRHNRVYWQGEHYYGFGPGAAAYLERTRSVNHRSVTTWIRRIREGRSAIQNQETLDPELQAREAVMLGLRQTAGIDRQLFRTRFGKEVAELAPQAYRSCLESGLLAESETAVALTREGRFLADSVMAEFL